jgi:outer membrane receptor protein involved in Fe transport
MLRIKTAILLLLVVLMSAVMAFAQTSRGTVSGVVTDQSGAIIPNAKVTLVELATNAARETTANAAGIYRFDSVSLGLHKLTVTAAGFSKAEATNVDVRANQTSAADFTMKIGSAQEVITVEATSAQVALQTDDQLRGGNISSDNLINLPVSGQNSLNLMTLLPGVIPTNLSGGGGLDSGIGSVNGSRPRANNFMIDGVENNDISVAGPALTLTNNDAIQEVSVQTANFSAEYGRSGGAVINQITKAGTNNLHGTAAWVYRSEALNAESFDEKQSGEKSKYLEHLPAFTLGGPIVIPHVYDGRNKTFFFMAGQWDRYNEGSQQKPVVVPTAAGIATLKSLAATCPNAQLYLNSIGTLVAPTASGATDISVPTNVFNVTGACTPTNRAGMTLEYGTATRFAPVLFKGNTQQVRVDHNFSDKHFINFRFMSSPGSYAGIYSLGMSPEFDAGYASKSYTGAISDTYIVSTHVTNELRLNYYRVAVDWPTLATSGLGTTLPTIGISGFTTLGTSSNYPQGRTFNTYQFQDTMTWMVGKHSIRFGVDVNRQIARQLAPMPVRGALTYAQSVAAAGTVEPFANFLDDFSGSGNGVVSKQFGSAVYHPNTMKQSYFFQDSWKMTQNLTVNLGLRYDYFGQPANENFKYPAVSMDAAKFPNTARIPVDKNNFGPTVGFAYSPKGSIFGEGKTVIRGGFQIGYDGWYNNLLSNMATGAPNNATNVAYNANLSDPAAPRGVANTYNTLFPALVAAPLSPLQDSASQFAANIVNPYTMRFSLGVQRELPGGMILDSSYVGSLGRKNFVSQELNPRLIDLTTGKAGARLYPDQGSRTIRASTANSNFNSMQIGLRSKTLRTVVGGVMFDTSYTFSKNMDVASETFATSSQGSAYTSSRWITLNDPKLLSSNLAQYLNPNLDYGVSDMDRRHRWITSFVWDIKGPKTGFLGQLAGGWSIGGSLPIMSGTPFSVLNGYDRDGDGSLANDRPDVGNPNAPITSRAVVSTTAQACGSGLWNPDAAACTTADQVRWVQSRALPGAKTAGRNAAWTTGFLVVDTNIMKKFRVTEGKNLEFRAEIFNLTNSNNFNYAPNGLTALGMRLDRPAGQFLPWKTQSDYYTNPGNRTMRIGAKFIF